MSYNNLCMYGDLIALKIQCNQSVLFDQIRHFKWLKYNPRKDIKRYGLSITSLNGELGGIDLDSIKEYNTEHQTKYNETSFKTFTDVYYSSSEIQKIVNPFKNNIGRSHIIKLDKGGYFPPHRDQPNYIENQKSLRIIIPLKNCNPPNMYFMYENNTLYFEHGRAYFLNTNKAHSVFSFKESYFIVLNVEANEEVYNIIGNHFFHY